MRVVLLWGRRLGRFDLQALTVDAVDAWILRRRTASRLMAHREIVDVVFDDGGRSLFLRIGELTNVLVVGMARRLRWLLDSSVVDWIVVVVGEERSLVPEAR